MSNFKLFRHYARYQATSNRLGQADHNNVSELDFIDGGYMVEFTDSNIKQVFHLIKKDRATFENMQFWNMIYSLIDIDNPENYLYLYNADTNKLITKYLILKQYALDGKVYYIVKSWDKGRSKRTLMSFDSDIEGGRFLKNGKVMYYTVGTNPPGVINETKYRKYLEKEKYEISKYLQSIQERCINKLTLLDTFSKDLGRER